MRIAAISDVHGNSFALRAVMDDIASQNVDLTVNLGDLLSGGVLPRETAEILMEWNIPTVRGNHERNVLTQALESMGLSDRAAAEEITDEQRAWLASLPFQIEPHPRVLAIHATPLDDVTYLLHTVEPELVRDATPLEILERLGDVGGYDLLLCGHTHLPGTIALPTGLTIVNPGSVGMPAYVDDHPYPHIIETGAPEASYAIVDDANGAWVAEFRRIPYDYSAAAEVAQKRGRTEVAFGIKYGTNPTT